MPVRLIACEQAPALDAGRRCKASNHNARSLHKMINIARLLSY